MKTKIVSFIIALTFICSSLSLHVFAETTETLAPTISVASVSGKAGGSIFVDISITNNPGVSGLGIEISYPDGFEIVNIKDGEVLSNPLHSGKTTVNPFVMSWDDALETNNKSGVLTTIEFKINENVNPGEYNISAGNTKYGIWDNDINPVSFEFVSGVITVLEPCKHSFSNYISDGNATCTENGTKTAECDYGCGETNTIEDEDTQLEHSFTEYISNENATCTQNGTKTAECDYGCGETSTVEDEGTQLEHSFTEYTIDKNPTCTEAGTKTSSCDYGCGAIDKITVSALGHDLIDDVCQRCGKSLLNKIVLVEDSKLEIVQKDDILSILNGIKIDSLVSEIKSNIKNSENVQILNNEGKVLEDAEVVGTGFKAQYIHNGEVTDEVTLVVKGDVDCDTQITTKDVAITRRHVANWEVSFIWESADVNCDEMISAKDVALVRRTIAGWENQF